jgi:hypothetical protein
VEITNEENNPGDIYEVPDCNYENDEDDAQSTYTALQRSGPGKANDDNLYGHLNQVRQNVYANQGETGI